MLSAFTPQASAPPPGNQHPDQRAQNAPLKFAGVTATYGGARNRARAVN